MSTTTIVPAVFSRILKEGYGAGAWHGPDLASAVADVTPEQAFQRPAAGRHNIAEIVLHHTWFIRSVIGQLTASTPAPFVLPGEDWFELSQNREPSWPEIRSLLDNYQKHLVQVVADLEARQSTSPLPEAERFDLVLGITCHAIYHAGQIQLIKRLVEAD
ncbi:MAG TPA: DinB family protein [Longimicrobiales bacterium]|nr:DinB family protein [Longimicrobiales bacterium]